MTTRSDWNSYKLEDGLNIWGDPEFKGSPVLAGGFTFGDAVADTLVIKGRVATGTIAGTELYIDDTYIYSQLIEIRAGVTDWTNVGSSFTGRYERYMASVDSAGKTLRGSEMYLANGDNLDVAYMLGTLVNLMGKGNSAITLMRGAEIKLEWLASDVVTDAVGLVIDFAGLAAPTNAVYGIDFEIASGAAACSAKVQEIRMKSGMVIMSGAGTPHGTVTAPKGSLWLRTDGTTTNDRAYINTDGSTTWSALTTAA